MKRATILFFVPERNKWQKCPDSHGKRKTEHVRSHQGWFVYRGSILIINVNDLRPLCLKKRQDREDVQQAQIRISHNNPSRESIHRRCHWITAVRYVMHLWKKEQRVVCFWQICIYSWALFDVRNHSLRPNTQIAQVTHHMRDHQR